MSEVEDKNAGDDEPMTEERWNWLRAAAEEVGRVMPSWRAVVAAEEWARKMGLAYDKRFGRRD